MQVGDYYNILPEDVAKVNIYVLKYVHIAFHIYYGMQGPVIDVTEDYSKNRKKDYTADTDDGYVTSKNTQVNKVLLEQEMASCIMNYG